MTMNNLVESPETPFLLYSGDNEKVHIKVLMHEETIWLTQKSISELFETTTDNVSLHLKNIYAEQELLETATTEDFSVVQNEAGRAVRRRLKHYNLDAIIAVGYRVSSKRATHFRMWATQILKEYIKKGFVIDDERLKQGQQILAKDYCKELHKKLIVISAIKNFSSKLENRYPASIYYQKIQDEVITDNPRNF